MAELSTLGSVIKTAYEGEADTNALTDTLLSKLNGIEASADVTDTANVTAAGALMDSEVTNLAAVKAFDPADYDAWGDPVDANIVPSAAATYTLGTSAASFASLYANNVRAQDSSALLLSVDTKTADTATSDIRVYGQDARAIATTNLDGGDVDIKAGAGSSLSAGDADGGFVYLNGGRGYGTGTHGNVVVGNNYGNLQVDSQIVSTITTGTAPLTVASTTVVTNLNADLLDGNEASAFLQNVVEDTTPQLGGNLDVQARTITTSTANGGITLTPNGTGNVTLGNFVLNADATIGAGQDNYVLTYDDASGTWGPEAGGAGGWSTMSDAVWAGGTQSEVADGASAVAFNFDTDAAYSTSGAKLLSLKNNATEKFSIDKDGNASVPAAFSLLNPNAVGFYFGQNERYFSIVRSSLAYATFHTGSTHQYSLLLNSASTAAIGFGTTQDASKVSGIRVALFSDAAQTFDQRNSTNAQTFRVYNTYTDASNYERIAINGAGSIVVETAGTGTDDIDLTLTPAGAGVVKFGTHSAIAAETVTGYITIKDAAGNSRKLAVVS